MQSLKKERNPPIYDKHGGHYEDITLSNKLDTERQILYDHLDVNLKNQNLQNQTVEQWLPGVEGWRR